MDPADRHEQLRRDKSDLLTEIALTKRTYPIAATTNYDILVEQCTRALVHARAPSAREDVRSCLAALAEMGLRLSPLEPTEEMMRAGLEAFALAESSDWTPQQVLQAVWRAMRNAGPI